MESILNFFEQYWGYTLFGSITVGSLVAFVIAAVKMFLSLRASKKETDEQNNTIASLMSIIKEKDIAQRAKDLELKQQAEYFQQVQAVTFKSLSYLIMASKLSTEDKLALTESFNKLTNTTPEQVQEAHNQVEEKVQEKVEEAEDIKEVVVSTVETAKSLLDKYNV